MPKCDFNKVARHIFRTSFPRNTSGCLCTYISVLFFPLAYVDITNL